MLILARCDKGERVGDPWDRGSLSMGLGTFRPLLSHKLLVYLTCELLGILLGGCCSHGLKKNPYVADYAPKKFTLNTILKIITSNRTKKIVVPLNFIFNLLKLLKITHFNHSVWWTSYISWFKLYWNTREYLIYEKAYKYCFWH
jgi:hypothetical protein